MSLQDTWGPGSLMLFLALNLVPGALQEHFLNTSRKALDKVTSQGHIHIRSNSIQQLFFNYFSSASNKSIR
jgi:hypothetical protein